MADTISDPTVTGAATATGPGVDSPETPGRIHTWPYLVRLELLCALAILIVTMVWSITIDAPLEEPANPNRTPNPSKAPWYFLGLQEMLVYFDPWMAGVALPILIIVGLMAIPYVDINPRGNGYYTWAERKLAIGIFLFGFLVLWLALILVGTFLRGPGWNLFWPGQYWDTRKAVALANVDLPYVLGARSETAQWLLGAALVLGYYPGLAIAGWQAFKRRPFFRKLGAIRYHIVALLLLVEMSLVIKIVLRLSLNVKYVWSWPRFDLNL